MDPNMVPSRATEETTRSTSPEGNQEVSTKRTEGMGQVAQEVKTASTGPEGASIRKERTVGMAPAAAKQYESKKGLFRAYQIIWYLLGFIEIVLAFRFFLKLTGANPQSGFVNFVYSLSNPFAGPFLNTFHASPAVGAETTSYFEWSTLVAGFVYALVAWGIVKLFQFAKPASPDEVEQSVQNQ